MADLSYVAVQVTLTLANTNYNVLNLLKAIEATCPATARELCLQSDAANADASMILIGDGKLSGTRYGYQLAPGQSRTYRSVMQNVLLGATFVRSATAGLLLNIEVMGA